MNNVHISRQPLSRRHFLTGAGVLLGLPLLDAMLPAFGSASPEGAAPRLFLGGSPEEIKEQQRKLALGQSIMDTIADQTSRLNRQVGARDRERLDQYLTGVRDLEKRLVQSAEWEKKPRPVVTEKPPVDVL